MPPALTQDAAPGTEPAPEEPSVNRRRNIVIGIGIAAFVGMAIFWLLILTGWFNTTSPDRLADRAWVQRAEQHCKVMQNKVNDLPKAQTAKSPAERASFIDEGTQIIRGLIGQLTADHPATADEQRVVEAWIGDWQVYLNDRAAYAQRIQQDPNAQALFSERHGENVATAIDGFATINSMPDCATPQDM
jgi:hypothetical protein